MPGKASGKPPAPPGQVKKNPDLMADTVVNNNVAANLNVNGRGLFGPFYISTLIGAIVLQDVAGSCVVQRTTDGGDTWAAAQLFAVGYVSPTYSAFFGGQNPATSASTTIHVVASNNAGGAGASKFSYNTYDIATGTWGTVVDLKTDVTWNVGAGANSSFIAPTRAGGWVTGYCSEATGAAAFRTNDGITWASAASPAESNEGFDKTLGLSADTGAAKDAAILFGDVTANETTAKIYKDADNTWSEHFVLATANLAEDSTVHAATVRVSDGLNFVVLMTAIPSATADAWLYSLQLNSHVSPVITQLGNVLTDSAETDNPGVFVNQATGVPTAIYGRGSAHEATIKIFTKTATDSTGATFGVETAYSEDAEEDYRAVHGGAYAAATGGRFQPVFFDDDDNDVFINLTNDIAISAVVPGAGKGNPHGTPPGRAKSLNWSGTWRYPFD